MLQKVVVKNLQNFCRFFAELLQLHILQKVLHFRPREESVTQALLVVSALPKETEIFNNQRRKIISEHFHKSD